MPDPAVDAGLDQLARRPWPWEGTDRRTQVENAENRDAESSRDQRSTYDEQQRRQRRVKARTGENAGTEDRPDEQELECDPALSARAEPWYSGRACYPSPVGTPRMLKPAST